MSATFESGFQTTLSQRLRSSGSDTTIALASVPITVTSGVMRFGEGNNVEWVRFTGVSGTSITGCTRGYDKDASTETDSTAGNKKDLAVGAPVKLVAHSYDLNQKSTLDDDNAHASGKTTFTSKTEAQLQLQNVTTTERDALTGVQNGDAVYNTTTGQVNWREGGAWVENQVGGTVPDASETVAGKSELATLAEQGAHTETGGSGSKLVLQSKNTIKEPETYTPAYLTGGSSAESTVATWRTLTDAEFSIDIDGSTRDVTGIDFSGSEIQIFIEEFNSNLTQTSINSGVIRKMDFLVTSGISNIKKIAFYGFKAASATGQLDVDIYADDGSGDPTGASLGQATLALGSIPTGVASAAEFEVTFSSAVSVSPSTKYVMVMSGITSADPNNLTFYSDNTNPYASGDIGYSTDGGTTWFDNVGTDLNFKVYSDIPEVDNMDEVAGAIQTAIRAETGSTETCTWDTDHLIISSADTTSTSAITVTSAVGGGSGTDISGAGASDWMDCDTGNGTVTDKVLDQTVDENKTPVLNSSGELDDQFVPIVKDLTATAAEINQALDGISANVTDTNLNTLTGGGSADALHDHDQYDSVFAPYSTGSATAAQTTAGSYTLNVPIGVSGATQFEVYCSISSYEPDFSPTHANRDLYIRGRNGGATLFVGQTGSVNENAYPTDFGIHFNFTSTTSNPGTAVRNNMTIDITGITISGTNLVIAYDVTGTNSGNEDVQIFAWNAIAWN
jgi:hypothetical protein